MSLVGTTLWAQDAPDTLGVELHGRVTDDEQEPVALCLVRIEGQAASTLAGTDGKYSIRFHTADSVVVVYSMMGFETRRRVLKKPRGRLTLHIVMRPKDSELSEVNVVDTRRQMSSTQELNTKDLKRMPSTTGNPWRSWWPHRPA